MKELKLVTIILVVLVTAPLVASAMSHQDHAAHDHDSSQAEQVGHNGMSSDGAMMIVGSMVSKGVKGMAHLKDVSAAMARQNFINDEDFYMAFEKLNNRPYGLLFTV